VTHDTNPPSGAISKSTEMKSFLSFSLFAILLLLMVSSCSVLDYQKEIEFNVSFVISDSDSSIEGSYLLDLMEYSSEYEQYMDKVETIDIQMVTCLLTQFSGNEDQAITGGLLTISDESGLDQARLAVIPDKLLTEMLNSEQELDLEQEGKDRVEELILNAPNKCLSTLSATVSSAPVEFTITFHITAIISGRIL
jgi:hypothetical protein